MRVPGPQTVDLIPVRSRAGTRLIAPSMCCIKTSQSRSNRLKANLSDTCTTETQPQIKKFTTDATRNNYRQLQNHKHDYSHPQTQPQNFFWHILWVILIYKLTHWIIGQEDGVAQPQLDTQSPSQTPTDSIVENHSLSQTQTWIQTPKPSGTRPHPIRNITRHKLRPDHKHRCVETGRDNNRISPSHTL